MGDGILPDFEYKIREGDAEIDYIHRRVARDDDAADIYFVINSNDTWAEIEGKFRITDRRPELWDPAAGKIREQNIFSRDGRRITMPLRLAPHGSVFVIFRKPLPVTAVEQIVRDAGDGRAMTAKSVQGIPQIDVRMLNTDKLSAEIWQSGDYHIKLTGGAEVRTGPVNVLPPIQITGPWKIFFQPGRGAPDSSGFDRLISWSDSEVEGIRYFSGTAEYQNKFIIQPEDFDAHLRYYLDLGDVKDLAEITVNGKVFPVMWKPPFRVDVTPSLKSGKNNLSVKITNLWPNRLIGDQRRPLDQRIGFTNIARFTRDTPLLESGLLGPVQIYRVSEQILDY
jgi:hypothetical protein